MDDEWLSANALAALFRPESEAQREDVLTGALVLAVTLRALRDIAEGLGSIGNG